MVLFSAPIKMKLQSSTTSLRSAPELGMPLGSPHSPRADRWDQAPPLVLGLSKVDHLSWTRAIHVATAAFLSPCMRRHRLFSPSAGCHPLLHLPHDVIRPPPFLSPRRPPSTTAFRFGSPSLLLVVLMGHLPRCALLCGSNGRPSQPPPTTCSADPATLATL